MSARPPKPAVLKHVLVPPSSPERFAAVLDAAGAAQLHSLIADARAALHGRVVWNVNSTARGGGVAEILGSLIGYSRGAGIDARWVVIGGEQDFFTVTKRLHNHLHGSAGDGGELGATERAIYEHTLAASAAELHKLVRPRDVVLLHDPQTAGLVEAVVSRGAVAIWRCHVGLDLANERAREAWAFLHRYVLAADAYVFSRAEFAWEGLSREKVEVIAPSIDPFSPKNAQLEEATVASILSASEIVATRADGAPVFERSDGSPGRVDRIAEKVEDQPLSPADRIVLQVSRWDRLKDPVGVLLGFAEYVAGRSADAHLVLAGPTATEVADDPEGIEVWRETVAARAALDPERRSRIHLLSLPMLDPEENAVIVNALQRAATIVVQKSLAEGFGLTVAEAMWKSKPIVAAAVGGIQDQVLDGETGLLLESSRDARMFGEAVCRLLEDPALAARMGAAGHERVRAHYLGPRHLGQFLSLIQRELAAHERAARPAPRQRAADADAH